MLADTFFVGESTTFISEFAKKFFKSLGAVVADTSLGFKPSDVSRTAFAPVLKVLFQLYGLFERYFRKCTESIYSLIINLDIWLRYTGYYAIYISKRNNIVAKKNFCSGSHAKIVPHYSFHDVVCHDLLSDNRHKRREGVAGSGHHSHLYSQRTVLRYSSCYRVLLDEDSAGIEAERVYFCSTET